jgi:hypothetical protein
MNKGDQGKAVNNSDEISITDLAVKIKSGVRYIKSKWLVILATSILGALIGLGYSILKKPTYTAFCNFVLEDSGKSGALGQYAGLASLAGIDLGGGNGGGIFQGDNILELYRSRQMIEKALLSEADFDGKKQLLIDRYVSNNDLLTKWKERDNIDAISFKGNPEKFSRKQDSLITDIVELFNKKFLSVNKPDKKLDIIGVQVISRDELFAKEFTNKLVENVNNFYVLTKTKKSSLNVQVLQHQADSVKEILNKSISGVASAIDAAPNANPLLLTLKVPSQKKQIDVQASTAVYGEIVKNLEISKISLRQEMPLIQVIDKPVLPLTVNKVKKVTGIITGLILGALLSVGYLLFRKVLTKV